LYEELVSVCKVCGAALSVLQILVECSCYNEDRVTFHFHGTLHDMLGDDCHSVSNVLAFLNGIGLAKSI
jgi:hypothetical protein